MSESITPPTRRRWFRFSLGTMLAAVTCVGIYAGVITYFRPRYPALTLALPIVAAAIIGGASLVPQRYGRWLRPVAILVIGVGAFALGIWLNSTNR